MAAQTVNVNLRSLEDFHRSLDERLAQIDYLVRQLSELGNRQVALGLLADAHKQVDHHSSLESGFAERVNQLRTATEAARQATAGVIANYRSAEARSQANAQDIAAQLSGVTSAAGRS